MSEDEKSPLRQIHLHESAEDDVTASSAVLIVVVSGTRLFAGDAALKEAGEVRRLIDSLIAAGAAYDDVSLEGVSVDVSKGIVGKSSAATYRLRARCADLALLPAFIDAVAAQKTCQLTGVEWRYDSADDKRRDCFRLCVEKAQAKARVIAEALGVELQGVVSVREPGMSDDGDRSSHRVIGSPGGMMRARASTVADQLGGLELAPTKKVRATLELRFAIGAARV